MYVSTNVVERLTKPSGQTAAKTATKTATLDENSRAFDTSFIVGDSGTAGRSAALTLTLTLI